MSSEMRRAAADYYRKGLRPIPLKHRSKEPSLGELTPYLERPATREELNSWTWQGVGLVVGLDSNLIVIDADGPEGEAELKRRGHFVGPMVRSGGGGLHLYCRHPGRNFRTRIRVVPGL